VPPGEYRVLVKAPGFLDYESATPQLTTTPVTLNVPLKRAGGASRVNPPFPRLATTLLLL
jgi:hypothetical protein